MMQNWLDRYMTWTGAMESPTRFHQWSALAAAGHVLGRNVWMMRLGKYCVFPAQIMVVLVGPTSVKKDSAMDQAISLLTSMPRGTVNILPSKTSAQDLLQKHLGKLGPKRPAVGFIATGEMGTWFSKESFMDQMVTLITELWNAKIGAPDPVAMTFQPFVKEYAFRSWAATLRDPAIGGLMAITPEGVATELPPSARQRGFFGRCLWVYEAATDRRPNSGTRWAVEDGATREKLMEGLEQLALLRGPIWFSPKGQDWFDHWYDHVHSPNLASAAEEASETGYIGRKPDHLLRIAITLACLSYVSGEREKCRVQVADLEQALQLLLTLERTLPRVMGEVGRAPNAEKMRRLLRYLEKGKKRRHQTMVYLHKYGVANHHEFDGLIQFAVDMKAIRVVSDGRATWYERVTKPGQHLRSTPDDDVKKKKKKEDDDSGEED